MIEQSRAFRIAAIALCSLLSAIAVVADDKQRTREPAPVMTYHGAQWLERPSRVEEEYLPDLDRILDAVDRSLAF